jgi:protein translocase SecG subunit
MAQFLPYAQILLSLLLIGAILLQRSEAALGAAFGQDMMNSTRYTRRGFEKYLFIATILIAILFAATAFASLFIHS